MEILLLLTIIFGASSIDCYSLTQGGGGSYGAYEAGVFTGLVHNLPLSEVSYYSVTGISAGSINSMGIAQYPQGSELAASDFLLSTIRSFNGSASIFQEFPGGLVDGLLFHSGLYNTTPEYNLIKSKLTQQVKRKVSLGTTNISTGLYNVYNETAGFQGLQEATMCSSAIPLLFETQIFNGWAYNDGGIYNMWDVPTAVERCFEVTDNQKEIHVDMITCFRHVLEPEGKAKTLDVFYRAYEISSYLRTLNSLKQAMIAYPDVDFRYYVQPSIYLPWNALNFTQALLESLITLGNNDAIDAIKNHTSARERFQDWNMYSDIIYPD